MDTPDNLQGHSTKAVIEKAFTELLQEKDINRITVTDIINKAHIHKSTFYEYFKNKNDLVMDVVNSFLNGLYGSFFLDLGNDSLEDRRKYEAIFQYYKDNQQFFNSYFNNFKTIKTKSDLELMDYNSLTPEQKACLYRIKYFQAGIKRVTKIWIENGCEETPHELYSMIETELSCFTELSSSFNYWMYGKETQGQGD